MMKETEQVELGRELRQGDILRIEDDRMRTALPALGVIINADCDLAHNKIDGVVAYLPIYSFRDYIALFWAPVFIAAKKKSLLEVVQKAASLNEGETEDLLRWLISSEPRTIATKLGATLGMKPKMVDELGELLEKLRGCIDPHADPFDTLCRFCRQERDPTSYAEKQLIAAKKDMTDGHFFISEIVGESDIGFVIRMRRIYTIDAKCCFTSVAGQRASSSGVGHTAVRVARLTPLYQFKMAQLFAHQFSRIGLPDEVSALSQLAIADMASQLTKVA